MTAQISAYGRLVADPQTRTTASGTSMAMARLAVSLPCNAAADGQATFWLGVIAFGSLMFWAADSDDYPEEGAKADMYRLGAMLGRIGEVAQALNDSAANAAFLRSISEKEAKGRAGK